jgi:AraC-like DNA-binding protein
MTAYSAVLFYYYHFSLLGSYSFLAYFIPIDFTLLMLMGPAIFFYLKTVLNQPVSFRSYRTWLHGIPAIPALAYAVYFAILPADVRINLLVKNFYETLWQASLLNGLFYIHLTSYLVVCYLLIRAHLKVSRKSMIGPVQIDVYWLKTFFMIDLIIMFSTAPIIFIINEDRVNSLIGLIAMDIQFIYIFLKSAWQTGVFPTVTVETPKHQEPSLKIADPIAKEYFDILIAYMSNNKPYLKEECSIQSVSSETNIPLHHLSNLINTRLNRNFSDFINEYRVEEAKKMLKNELFERITIEAIGFECGFGSKSSFNKAFKKYTNSTPSEYRLEKYSTKY